MDKPIQETPAPDTKLQSLIDHANAVYRENFDGSVWFGRCIFISWYCERGKKLFL